ncbi:MAG: ATP synthase subunit I [Gallionella sp.]|nr:ATP synthase subunit I [Gallionella sp.]
MTDEINDNACNSEIHGYEKVNRVHGMDETKITINHAFQKAARWQIIVTVIICAAILAGIGVHAAISSFLGGMAALVGGYAGVLMTRQRVDQSPGGVLIALLKAEITKIMVISLQLLAIFKLYDGLVAMALIGGLAASVLVSGAGLGAVGNNKK